MKHPVLQHSLLLVILWSLSMNLSGQELPQKDTTIEYSLSTGWADEAVGIGYVTAPSVFVLTFISGVVSEWNSGLAPLSGGALAMVTYRF